MDKNQVVIKVTERYERWISRGKCLETGEWVIGVYMPIFEEIYVVDEQNVIKITKVDPATVGRRLKVSSYGDEDKFLFEGDVVDYGWVVTWVGRDVPNSQGENTGMAIGWYIHRDDFESWTEIIIGEDHHNVLGNIHDDPELPQKIRKALTMSRYNFRG